MGRHDDGWWLDAARLPGDRPRHAADIDSLRWGFYSGGVRYSFWMNAEPLLRATAPVPAHDQNVTHSYRLHYPAHPAREGDPHYRDFDAYRRRTRASAVCAVGGGRNDFSECEGGLELHHSHVEFSLQNGVDLKWLEADYPGISNPDKVGAWVESADNLEWLCLVPGSPVLMDDGSTRPIEDIVPGDRVITHDGTAQLVEGVSRKRYRGEVASFGGASFTPTHKLLTCRGWMSASQIFNEVRVHGSQVILLRGEQNEVLRSVIGSLAVEMVDTFAGKQGASDHLFHDPSMFHDGSLCAVSSVDDNSDVSPWRNGAPGSVSVGALLPVKSGDATGVGAVETGPRAPVGVAVKAGTADLTSPHMRWVAPMLTWGGFYSGWVHDLSVAHNHSFVAGGIAVHNCERHHRGMDGVHLLSASDWEAAKYVRGLVDEA